MENNYSIKYALMPIYEQNGYTIGLNSLEKDYDIICYIVSPCYLTKEIKEYLKDGSTNLSYEVVFLYSQIDDFDKSVPNYNFSGQCYNATKISHIYDDYETTKEVSESENEKIFIKNLAYLPASELALKYDELLKQHQDKLNKYYEFEKRINKEYFSDKSYKKRK